VRQANDKKGEGLTERLVPKKPVKVGGSWEITSKGLQQLASVFGDVDTSLKCKAEGKLVKAYKKDGKQFGVVAIDLSLALEEVKGMTFDHFHGLALHGAHSDFGNVGPGRMVRPHVT
jgi:hypothetical protein